MEADKFYLSAAIIFDRQGKLRDGQHRLKACVQSKVSFDTIVRVNQSEEVIEYLDIGKPRSLANVLQIRNPDEKYTNESAAMCRPIQFMEDDEASIIPNKYTLREYLEVQTRYKPSIKAILGTRDSEEKVPGIFVGPVTGALAWAYSYYPLETLKFAKQYMTVLILTEAMPANTLRKSMLRMTAQKERSESHRTRAVLHKIGR